MSRRGLLHRSTAAGCLGLSLLGGCRGDRSEEPPRQFFPDMDEQPKWNPQAGTRFFQDGSTARAPDQNAVAFGRMPIDHEAVREEAWAVSFVAEREGLLADNDAVYLGKAADGSYVDYIPVPVTLERIERGRERFNIFCAACHGVRGDGDTPVAERFIAKPVNLSIDLYTDPAQRTARDGYIFEVIRNGVRTMPGYDHSLDAQDTWNVVMYVRALQKSRSGTLEDAPQGERDALERDRPAPPPPPAEGVTPEPTEPAATPAGDEPAGGTEGGGE